MSASQHTDAKVCSKCHSVKPIAAFGLESRRPDGRRCFCRECGTRDAKQYRKDNPVKWRRRQRRYKLKKKYNLTTGEYDDLLAKQNGACALCMTMSPMGRHKCFHVDHDHETGRVRGLLCNSCNIALAQLGDDERGILRVLAYVREKQ